MVQMGHNRILIFIIAALLVLLPACLPSDGVEGDTVAEVEPYDPNSTVCDPFSGVPAMPDMGIKSKLYYLDDSQPRAQTVLDLIGIGHLLDANIYFNRLNIPTRPFDRGFYTMAGDLITNHNGDALYEYFGLNLETKVQLAPQEQPGFYQLAVLSDDGAILYMNQQGSEEVIVNNDGTHPTRMSCATTPIYLDRDSKIPTRIVYHQGPRYHIALMVMWRPWPEADGDPVIDVHCNKQGNSYFFDSTMNPPQPKTNYYDLLSRGWKVLEVSNYALPENDDTNPCTPEEETLTTSAASLTNVTRNSVTVSWTTNIPATSKVVYTNIGTGQSFETVIDSSTVTNHTVEVTGLTANTLYSFKAVSTTDGGQSIESDEVAIRTLR